MIPDWLHNAVIEGLQKLIALRLPGTPPQDAVAGTAAVWLEAIDSPRMRWDESLDLPRVQRAFRALFINCDRWPAPKLFIQHLGNRDPPRALPPPPLTREQVERNRVRIRELSELMRSAHQMPKPQTVQETERNREGVRALVAAHNAKQQIRDKGHSK